MSTSKTQETPQALDWTSPVRYLKGVGPEKQRLLNRLELEILADLFYFFPRRYEKRFPIKKPGELAFIDKECVSGTVLRARFARMRGGRGIFTAQIGDGDKSLQAIYYNSPYMTDVFVEGARVLLYGKAEMDGSKRRMIHPEYEVLKEGAEPVHAGRWTPVYPLTEDLSQKGLRSILNRTVTAHLGCVDDLLPEILRKAHKLTTLAEAFRGIHFPKDVDDLRHAYRRLVFDEFFLMQLAVEMRKAELRKDNHFTPASGATDALDEWVRALEFELTGAQKIALKEILSDMKSGRAMHRLVQGDVGSGKTVLAAAALFFAAKSGYQGAVMAPTEVLAQQLFFQMQRFLEPSGLRCVYVAQSADPEEKKEALAALASGQAQVAVGTHALLSGDVRFLKLGLAVVDEQHKFGVSQRAALKNKGFSPHFLLMTATPIPRTLSLTLYGDLDISVIYEKPKGRVPVRTLWLEEARREGVYRWLDGFMSEGSQAFVICPQVGGRGSSEARSATAEFERLKKIFPKKSLGLLHGRLKAPEKTEVMRRFKEKKIDLLVSTVVVEVGVDIPDARCMIIENAERFGLAQLHQLRGRVGRSKGESFCLLFAGKTDEQSSERLAAFETTDSGFDIAEKDLEQRGGGEVLGQKQHGLARLRIGNLEKDMPLFLEARKEAIAVIASDSKLDRKDNKGLLRLLRQRYGGLSKIRKTVTA